MAGSTGGRPRDPEVDARIVEATRGLIREGGLDAVTITAVAERAGVGRPTVYRRYPDRETLALLVLHADLEDRLQALIAAAPGPELPLVERVVAMFAPFLRYYGERPAISAALLQLAMFSPRSKASGIEPQLMRYVGWIAERLEEAKARGELRPDAEPQVFAMSAFALYLTTAVGAAQGLYPDPDTALGVFAALIGQLVRGVAPDAPGGGYSARPEGQ